MSSESLYTVSCLIEDPDIAVVSGSGVRRAFHHGRNDFDGYTSYSSVRSWVGEIPWGVALLQMSLHVSLQFVLACEGSLANGADVGFLSGVGAEMAFEVGGAGKGGL